MIDKMKGLWGKQLIVTKWMGLDHEPQIHRMLLYGGARSGKTFSVINKMYLDALTTKNTNQLVVRKELTRARSAIQKFTAAEVIGLHGWRKGVDYHYDTQDNIMTFLRNGSRVHYAGLDDNGAVGKILGREFSRIFIDEAQETGANVYHYCTSRLAEISDIPRQLILGMNPTLQSHYTYQIFFKKLVPGTKRKLEDKRNNYRVLQMNPVDNPLLMEAGQDYIEQLKNMPRPQRMQFYEGEFRATDEYGMFPEHFIRDASVKPYHMDTLAIGVDPAITRKDKSDNTGIVLAGRKDNSLYIFKEASGKYKPMEMASIVVNLQKLVGGKIVIEQNSGGDYLVEPIKAINPEASVELIPVNQSKLDRTIPLHSKYTKHEVVHCAEEDKLSDYESQLHATGMRGYVGEGSPDTLDAAIMAAQHLFPDMRAKKSAKEFYLLPIS